jgi:hypothetical protein
MTTWVNINIDPRSLLCQATYTIRCVDDGAEWYVRKDFRDFVALDKQLSAHAGLSRLQLPPQGLIGFRARFYVGAFNKKRLEGLRNYLSHIFKQIDSLSHIPGLEVFFHGSKTKTLDSFLNPHCDLQTPLLLGKTEDRGRFIEKQMAVGSTMQHILEGKTDEVEVNMRRCSATPTDAGSVSLHAWESWISQSSMESLSFTEARDCRQSLVTEGASPLNFFIGSSATLDGGEKFPIRQHFFIGSAVSLRQEVEEEEEALLAA